MGGNSVGAVDGTSGLQSEMSSKLMGSADQEYTLQESV